MLRSTVKNVTFRSVHGISSSYVFARLYSSQQTTNFYAHSQNVVTRSNSSAVSKDSHDQGKIALTSALRKSFISTGKNTRSEAERQDALFQQSFNNPAIHRLMSTAVIEDTFWTLIEGGDSFLVTKASGQIPDHFYSNSILNACILAFGRTNKPNKGLELLLSLAQKSKQGSYSGVSFTRSASLLHLEYSLRAFCTADRIEQAEEILAQWLYLSRRERLKHLQELAEMAEGGGMAADMNSELIRIEAIIPAFVQRVNMIRSKSSAVFKKSRDRSDPIRYDSQSPKDVKRNFVAGDELEGEVLLDMREEHGFRSGKMFSKEQELRRLDLVRDTYPGWEHSLDLEDEGEGEGEQAPSIHVLEDADHRSNSIRVEDLIYCDMDDGGYMMEDLADSGEDEDEWSVIPLPSDRTLCMMAKMYSSRGAWDSCLNVCSAMILQRKHELSLSLPATGTEEEEVDLAQRYSASVSSPLAVCYRETLSALCASNRFEAAFYLTRKVKAVGVVVTPSCIAMLLHMYEINEDLSGARSRSAEAQAEAQGAEEHGASSDRITLLDFQDDILSTCLACAAFDRTAHTIVRSSRSSSSRSSSGSSSGSSDVIYDRRYSEGQASDHLSPLSYEVSGAVEADHDHGSTGALITTNIKLLCSRGLVFAAEDCLFHLYASEAHSSVPFEATALIAQHLATRGQFKRAVVMYGYLDKQSRQEVHSKDGEDRSRLAPVLEGERDRRAQLSSVILPQVYHSICNEFRKSRDVESMAVFVVAYGLGMSAPPM